MTESRLLVEDLYVSVREGSFGAASVNIMIRLVADDESSTLRI